MSILHSVTRSLRATTAILLLALASVRPAGAVDFTDLWWNSGESGWGVNFIQAGDFIFATFFIYGTGLQPTWYSGQLTQGSNGVWAGPLFLTAGSYFGAPWNPGQRATAQVGTVTFTPATAVSGTLAYNVGGVAVNKTITRQTLQTIAVGASYLGGIYTDVYDCTNPLNNQTYRLFSDFVVAQDKSQMQIDFAVDAGGTCSMRGAYAQDGQLFRMPAALYTCSNGLTTTASVTQIKATTQGFEGQWIAAVNQGCTEAGYWSAVLK